MNLLEHRIMGGEQFSCLVKLLICLRLSIAFLDNQSPPPPETALLYRTFCPDSVCS